MLKKAVFLLMTVLLLSLTACNLEKIEVDFDDLITESNESSSESIYESSSESSLEGETPSSEESSSESTSHEKPDVPANEQGGGMYGSTVMILNDGRAFHLYSGGYEEGRKYAEALNQLKTLVGDNVNVFSMVVPTEVSFYLPEKFAEFSGSEWDNIEYINENFDGIIPVDAYTALSRHVDEDIYFRTDFHWQQLGAYYAAEEFAKTALTEFAPLSDYEKAEIDGYVGTMYGMSGEDPRVRDNPDTLTYYKPKNKYSVEHYMHDLENEGYYSDADMDGLFLKSLDDIEGKYWYWLFLGGGVDAYHIKTDVGNGRKLLLVKDSFGDPLLPCLTSSFEEIWAITLPLFKKSISQFVNDNGMTDVLFCIDSFKAVGKEAGYELDKLFNIL